MNLAAIPLIISIALFALFANGGIIVAVRATCYILKVKGESGSDAAMKFAPYFLGLERELEALRKERNDVRAEWFMKWLRVAKLGFIAAVAMHLIAIPIWALCGS
jgi:hypothetical protein